MIETVFGILCIITIGPSLVVFTGFLVIHGLALLGGYKK